MNDFSGAFDPVNSRSDNETFSDEQIAKFVQQFESGYDLVYDSD